MAGIVGTVRRKLFSAKNFKNRGLNGEAEIFEKNFATELPGCTIPKLAETLSSVSRGPRCTLSGQLTVRDFCLIDS